MGIDTIVSLIGSLGFPIVCCIILFWRMFKSDEAHKAEMDNLKEAINNNTLALSQLADKIGSDVELKAVSGDSLNITDEK